MPSTHMKDDSNSSGSSRRPIFWRLVKQVSHRQVARTSSIAAAELVCPITLQLPIDPVMAEDGRIYERVAIEKHFQSRVDANLDIRSPTTNEPISQRLAPSPQTKTQIAASIKKGMISGDLAKRWKEQEKQRRRSEQALLKKAKHGDIKATEFLITCYFNGWQGFPQDKKMACGWARRAHSLGSVNGTALLGEMLMYGGEGVEKDVRVGATYLSQAAKRGSTFAAFVLEEAMDNGTLRVAPSSSAPERQEMPMAKAA